MIVVATPVEFQLILIRKTEPLKQKYIHSQLHFMTGGHNIFRPA